MICEFKNLKVVTALEIIIFLLVRLTHFLPSGKYQLAMVPYQKNEDQILSPMAKPSCSCRLERLDLGKHALSVIISNKFQHYNFAKGFYKRFLIYLSYFFSSSGCGNCYR